MADIFSPESTKRAIQTALANNPLPEGVNGALVLHGDYDAETHRTTMTAVLAQRVGEHWTLSEDVELHDKTWRAGVNVIATW